MEALIVENDPLVRDQLKVALQQFPDVHVATGTGYAALNELRGRAFDCVFLGLDGEPHEAIKLLQHLRAVETDAQLFVVAPADRCHDLSAEKTKFDIHAMLSTPLSPRELFALLGRLFERRAQRAERAAPPRRATRPAAAARKR